MNQNKRANEAGQGILYRQCTWRNTALAALFVLLAVPVYAQSIALQAENDCKGMSGNPDRILSRQTIASVFEDEYDIRNIHFDLQLSDESAALTGAVTTIGIVTSPLMDRYTFELDDTLIIDSVVLNGAILPVTSNGKIRTVMPGAALPKGTLFSARVHYRGYPRGATDIHNPGLHHDTATNITFSMAEPYFAHLWWPCKQSLRDKIDSVSMWITVPAGVSAGSNGLLERVTTMDAGKRRYEWKTRYPIDYYLISVAVSKYYEYSYMMRFDNSTDSMPIVNYIINTPLEIARIKPWLDSTALLINYMSELFGRYPFWKEKYGHCQTPSGVNMEHQTMTSTKFPRLNVVVHELAHQWFGNQVTCGAWHDIWLNEGFATYAQYLAYDKYDGLGPTYMRIIQEHATSAIDGSVYVTDTTNWNRIFDGRLTYNKAACVIHMLRYVVNDDAKFFGILRAYLQQFSFGNATTNDFKLAAEKATGMALDTFFTQWIYGEGYPYLSANWNQVNDAVFLRIRQASSAPWSTFHFSMEVPIRFYSVSGDTTLRIPINDDTHELRYVFDKKVDSIAIDPDRWLLFRKAGDPLRDPGLNLLPETPSVNPNPATGWLYVSYKNLKEASLIIQDAAGRKAITERLTWDAGIAPIDISYLPKGIYLYQVVSDGKVAAAGKISKE